MRAAISNFASNTPGFVRGKFGVWEMLDILFYLAFSEEMVTYIP